MKYLLIPALFCLLASCTPINQSSSISGSNPKSLQLIDRAYESQIKTIQLHPRGNTIAPAVTRFGQWDLLLQFDDLRNGNDSYYARIVHCNYNWTKSDLQDLDFLASYNEFPINSFEYSVDSHVPYVHYTMAVPPVKLPGNYVLVVFRGSDKNDIILSHRFMVFDNQITFNQERNLVGAGRAADLNQQLNFTVNYKNVEILNPMMDVHAVIRQNKRWDNMAVDIKPSFLREIEKEIEYRFFDDTQMFKGGNEFRFFDLRSLNHPGRNVATINKNVKPFEAFIAKDKSREYEAYAQYSDLNGNFIIENYDYKDLSYSNYVNINFTLASPPVGDVYVAGALNYWNLNRENKMDYDTVNGNYVKRMLLKQGWYDYQYVVKSPQKPSYFLEGSHFETENIYEILIYYKPFQPRAFF